MTMDALPGYWMSEWAGQDMVVYPCGDRTEHDLNNENCDCQPQVEYPRDGIKMIVHNAFDGRE